MFVRFVWAVAAFVLAALMIGAGIAQRTVFQGPSTVTTEISVDDALPYVLVDGAVLNAQPGTQTLRARGDGEVFAAYGRTADLKAWLSDVSYTSVSLGSDGATRSITIEPVPVTEGPATAPEEAPADETAADQTAEETEVEPRSPVGSDLWLDEFQQSDVLIAPLQLPEGMSVLVTIGDAEAAPTELTVSWPIANATPWAGPLIVAGGLLMGVGVLLYILGIRHVRRSRGPRRKGLPMPVTEPIDLSVEGADKGVISSGTPRRRQLSAGRRGFVVLPAVAVSALLFAGCSAESWPQLAPTETPSPTPTVIVPEGQQQPAVTRAQAERILTRISTTVAEADEARDAAVAATRLDGPALAARETNYQLRGELTDYAAIPPIVDKPLEIILPQAYDGWPRSVMAVVDDEDSRTSSILLMTQADPWSDYKLSYLASLEADTEMPDLAPAYVGATQVQPDSPFLVMAPQDLSEAYADILNNGEESEYYAMFDAEGDQFRLSVEADRQKRLEEFNQTAAETGTLSFSADVGVHDPVALATLESGAIVAVDIHEQDTVTPTNEDAVIKLTNNPTVQALAGAEQSAKGFTTTFSDQLFFYVPGQGSNEKIRLLGYASHILDAQVIS